MEHIRSGDFVPAISDGQVSARALASLGISLFLGVTFWATLFVLFFR